MSTINVATTGSDTTGNGSSATPYATLAHAGGVAAPGDTVLVQPGTYNSAAITTTQSGTASARLTYQSATKWGAKLVVHDASNTDFAWVNRGDYVTIDGFDLTSDTARIGICNQSTVGFGTIQNCHVHNLTNTAAMLAGNAGGSGVLNTLDNGATNCNAIGNVVHDIAFGLGQNGLVHGVYHSQISGSVVNNISYRNDGDGVTLWHAASGTAAAPLVISNNLCFANGRNGISVGSGDNGATTSQYIVVENNICRNNGSTGLAEVGAPAWGTGAAANIYRNNVLFSNPTNLSLSTGHTATCTITTDPLHVNYSAAPGTWSAPPVTNSSADYHLSAGSPAINAGIATLAPATDINGATWVSRDIGPYAYIVLVVVGASSATIRWTTDRVATSWVEYGTTTAYGSSSGLIDPTLVTSHSVVISGLLGSTLYHFRVHSRNVGGTDAASSDQTFTTAGASASTMQVLVVS